MRVRPFAAQKSGQTCRACVSGQVRAAKAAWAYGWAGMRPSWHRILAAFDGIVHGIGDVSARSWRGAVAVEQQQATCGAYVRWVASWGRGQGRLGGSGWACRP